jgi:uncharacterized protein (DUF1778 family)
MATIASERVTTRMTTETKELLEKALVLSGYSSLSSFITNAARTAAKKLIEQEMVIDLSQKEAISFLEALDKPRKTNPRFLQAARNYKETITHEHPTTE